MLKAPPRRLFRVGLTTAVAASLLVAVPSASSAAPADTGCAKRNLRTVDQLLSCVNADDAFEHLAAFQAIADANGGTRASGTPGYDASADYVQAAMEAAGYTVERQVFDFSLFTLVSDSFAIDGVAVEYDTMEYSAPGEVTGNVIPVDLALDGERASTSGCEPEDFEGLDFSGPDDIALMQRGECDFAVKAANAEAADAEAALIFNQGNTPDREALFFGTLGGPGIGIPVMSLDFATGAALATSQAEVAIAVDAFTVTRSTSNVIADLPGKNPDNVVMAGAHLDSVPEGPGVQDNGSGSAALLAVAEALTESGKYVPQNTVRFAWWGAEEAGLVGSNEYIFNPEFGLTDEEYFALAAYLNFDMIASPNFIYGVYDADESTYAASDFGVVVPPGSAELEDLFEAYYTAKNVPYDDTAFSGRSDYSAFISVGIPSSGLFTGAEVIKTPQQEAIWGGTAGEQFDPCYHLACDTYGNVSAEALEVNVDAVADAMFRLAASTETINGVKGAKLPGRPQTAIDGPQGTNVEGLGGDDHYKAPR